MLTPKELTRERKKGEATKSGWPSSHHTGNTVLAWVLSVITPLCLIIGFTVTTDASGAFRLNGFGSFTNSDELLIKSSLMKHRSFDALLFGDSRAAFTNPQGVGNFQFFNAGGSGGLPRDAYALMRTHQLSGVRLVVLMSSIENILGECGGESRRLKDPLTPVRHSVTWDALFEAVSHIRFRLKGYLPAHSSNGTRYPDTRVLTPPTGTESPTPRYLERVEQALEKPPLHEVIARSQPCLTYLKRMASYTRDQGAVFVLILVPINDDILEASNTNQTLVRSLIRKRVLLNLPFASDFTASEFSNPKHFPPSDATYFRSDSGRKMIEIAVQNYCNKTGGCNW